MEKIHLPEGLLTEEAILTFTELCIVCEIDEHFGIEMIDLGIIEPQGSNIKSWQFSVFHMLRVKKAKRLSGDLKLNLPGIALVLDLLDEIDELQDHIHTLEQQLKFLEFSN